MADAKAGNLADERVREASLRPDLTEAEVVAAGFTSLLLLQVLDRHSTNVPRMLADAELVVSRLQEVPGVHSTKRRVKSHSRVLEKLLRKGAAQPGHGVTPETYPDFVTDCTGVRAIHLFKGDWAEIHRHIQGQFDLREQPKAYVREGDPSQVKEMYTTSDCALEIHPRNYRSVHYLVELKTGRSLSLVEIQVRTLFEEGWSEIDHGIRYRTHGSDARVSAFLDIFNRLAGSADEMGSFLRDLADYTKGVAVANTAAAVERERLAGELKDALEKLEISDADREALQRKVNDLENASKRQAVVWADEWKLPPGSLVLPRGMLGAFDSTQGHPITGKLAESFDLGAVGVRGWQAATSPCAVCGKSRALGDLRLPLTSCPHCGAPS